MSADGRSSFKEDFGREGDEMLVGAESASEEHTPDHERLRALSAEINHRFPPRPDRTVLVLYDLDPESLQVQWSITPDDLSNACRAFPGEPADLRQVLRLSRLDGEGKAEVVDRVAMEASAARLQGQQRFAPERLEADYECELGLESGDGGWLMLARSNRTWLPGGPGDSREAKGARIETSGNDRHPDPLREGDRTVEPALATEGEPLYPVFPCPDFGDDGRAPRSSLVSARRGAASAEDRGPLEGRRSGERLDSGRATVETALGGGDSPAMPPPLLPSTQYLAQSLFDDFLPRYDPRAALSSAALRGSLRKPAELDLQAELIVKGRTRPGAPVELFGLSITAGEDGLFSLRFPVEDPLILSLILGGHLSAPGVPVSGKS